MSPKKSYFIMTFLNLALIGFNLNIASPDIQTTDTLTWVVIQTTGGPQPRTDHSMVQLPNGQILLFGGVDTNGVVLNDTWLYTPHEVTLSIQNKNYNNPTVKPLEDWTPISPLESPSSRQGHKMVTLPDGRVLLFGGTDNQGVWFNDLHYFVEDQWEQVTPLNNPPPGRADTDLWFRNDKFYIYGGYGPSLFEDLWSYDINSNQWQNHQGPPDFISPHAFPMVNSNFVTFIDVHLFPYNDGKIFSYDMDQYTWYQQQLINWPPFSRSFYDMVQVDDKAYMLGGATWDEFTQSNIYSNEVWKFDYPSLTWTQETSMPYPVYDGTAVYDKNNDYITYWGGRLNNETFFPAENVMIGYWGSPPVDISSNEELPNEFKLEQNYPNPFNGSTIISYSIPTSPLAPPLSKGRDMGGVVTLKVYNILGQEVATLVNEYQLLGRYVKIFNVETHNGTTLPSGVYFYQLQANGYSETKKFVLLK